MLRYLMHGMINSAVLGPIHTIPDSSRIGLLPASDRPSVHIVPDESDMLHIAFAGVKSLRCESAMYRITFDIGSLLS